MDDKAKARKETPVFSGVLMYFPKAVQAVAQCSFIANEQHNPNTPMHWDRSKSKDELDALTRHLLEAGKIDDDGIRHSTKVAWRALANLEKELEKEEVSHQDIADVMENVMYRDIGIKCGLLRWEDAEENYLNNCKSGGQIQIVHDDGLVNIHDVDNEDMENINAYLYMKYIGESYADH